MAHLAFYYDVVCPYAYLASTQVEALAERTGVQLEYRPMLLGGVFRALEVPDTPQLPPAKAKHNLWDMHRWADLWKVTLEMPSNHPQRCVTSMRLILAAAQSEVITQSPITHVLYRAYWVDGIDMNSPDALKPYLSAEGFDADALWERAHTQAIKDALRVRTDEAVSRGVFGAPAFIVNDQLYWGQDRMHFVERALEQAV